MTPFIVLQTAPWTQMTADLSAVDKADIRSGLATENNVNLARAATVSVKIDTVFIPGLL